MTKTCQRGRNASADLPDCYGPCTTCYNRFVLWRRAGVWARIMDALAAAHDAAVQTIDTSIVRVHQHAACIGRSRGQSMDRSRGGYAVVDTNGLPVRLGLTAGEAHDNRLALRLLSRLRSGSMLPADRGYDADWIRAFVTEKGRLGQRSAQMQWKEADLLQPTPLSRSKSSRAILQHGVIPGSCHAKARRISSPES
jgi:transposase